MRAFDRTQFRRSRIALLVSLALLAFTELVQGQTRCGKERWSIKTGTDSGAASIDTSNIQDTTIASITSPDPPSPIPSDSRVSPSETTTWRISATLTSFKFENEPKSGDSDYHLVLTDDAGSTMIVEIPHPGCVGSSSPFVDGITKARQTFDARFTPTTAFQNVSVPVTVTGVGMFDFSHGQRGYAANGIELHPVLDIIFNDAPGPSAVSAMSVAAPRAMAARMAPAQLIKDPSFEAGPNGTAWSASPGVISDSNSEPAHSGKWKAWLGGAGTAHTDSLSQVVAIPSSAKSAQLSFWLRISTDEVTSTREYDTLQVLVKDGSSAAVPIDDEEGSTFSNLDATAYGRRVFDLSRFAGHQITILFSAKEDRGKATSFLIDDVRLVTK